MRSSINTLLHLTSFGMLGLAGWLIQQTVTTDPRLTAGASTNPSRDGFNTARQLVAQGRNLRPSRPREIYSNRRWWEQFQQVNLIGRVGEDEEGPGPLPPVEPKKLLADLVRLMSLMHQHDGERDRSQVVIRYREDAEVQIPVARAHMPDPLPATVLALGNRVGDRGRTRQRTFQPVPRPDPFVQHLRVGEALWEPFGDIVLLRVADDARSAFFRLPPETGSEEPRTEQLFKDEMELSQHVARQLTAATPTQVVRDRPERSVSWVPVRETRRVGDGWFISRADDEMIRQNPEELLAKVQIRTYSSPTGATPHRGIRIVDVDPELGRRFGVRRGDVILEVNGIPVKSRAEAIDVGTQLSRRGVTVFRVRIMSMGRIEERTYTAPDR